MNDDFKGHLIKLTWTCGIPVPWNSLTICSNVLTAYHKPAKSQAVKTTCFIQRKNNQTNDLSCSTKYNCLIFLFGFAKHEPFNFLSKQIKGPFILYFRISHNTLCLSPKLCINILFSKAPGRTAYSQEHLNKNNLFKIGCRGKSVSC